MSARKFCTWRASHQCGLYNASAGLICWRELVGRGHIRWDCSVWGCPCSRSWLLILAPRWTCPPLWGSPKSYQCFLVDEGEENYICLGPLSLPLLGDGLQVDRKYHGRFFILPFIVCLVLFDPLLLLFLSHNLVIFLHIDRREKFLLLVKVCNVRSSLCLLGLKSGCCDHWKEPSSKIHWIFDCQSAIFALSCSSRTATCTFRLDH